MKIISWNVNGIRAVIRKKNFFEFVSEQEPDIVCIQETKAHPDQVDMQLAEYPHHFWNAAEKKGYSGVAVFSKHEPKSVLYDIGIEKHDQEGRVLTLEFETFYLVTVYTPNSKRGLERLEYRQKEWDKDFLKFIKKLEKKKPVMFCGDLNVAHKEIDLARPKDNKRNAGFTEEDRDGIDNIIKAGYIDSFREFEKGEGHYTWWSNFNKARDRNIGWRIDYFCVSSKLRKNLKKAFILPKVMGSDHCPVGVEMTLK